MLRNTKKRIKVVHRIASALEAQARVPGISQEMLELLAQATLEQQLKQSCEGARQCGKCHFGPVMHHACSDLEKPPRDTRWLSTTAAHTVAGLPNASAIGRRGMGKSAAQLL